nr:hypothetical protein [Tanacetum cinerariifolium]
MALVFMAKAFTVNDTTPINKNQQSSSDPRNMQIAQPGIQNAYNAVQNYGNRNVVVTRAEGNGNGINEIQLTPKEFDFMADAGACEKIERVNANCTLEDNLQQASTSGTPTDNALVYDLDGSAEAMSHEDLYFSNTSKTVSVSKSFSIPNEEFSDDTSPSVA